MTVCSSGHEEIVYDGRWCPACHLIEKMDEAERRHEIAINAIEDQLGDKDAEIRELSASLNEAELRLTQTGDDR